MNDRLLELYHYLPHPIRSFSASLWGLHLRSWRYSSETEMMVEQILERDGWASEQWKRWQEERLAYVLNRAATKVPYYREYWLSQRRKGNSASWECLGNWPILNKQRIQETPIAFVSDDCDTRKMFHEHTSGTTGKPLHLYWSRDTVRGFYALFEARWRHWYGVTRRDRWAILGGQVVSPVKRAKPPFWVWNYPMNQLYMSSYHLSPGLIRHYIDALKYHRVKYIFGYTSALSTIANEILRLKRQDLQMEVAITNAEPLLDYQRQAIGQAFNCPVRETYGNSEIVASASECESQRMHLWPELGYVEIARNSDLKSSDASGDLIGTTLLNADMPLIRYRLGDRVSLSEPDYQCGCGRRLPVLNSIEGRSDDVLYTPDGRSVGRLGTVFHSQLPLREAQIVQEKLDRLRIRYVPASDCTSDTIRAMVKRLRDRMGDVEVVLEKMDEIPRERNGKFRFMICQLSESEKHRLSGNQDCQFRQ
jgi:phenylacetate-CoA ligase